MSTSDLWRLEQPIVAHYSGAGINAELMSTAIRGQWRGKLRAKGYELLGCPDGAPIPPMSAWASKNWPWLFCCCLLLWARENSRKDVEARVWEWVEATLEEQLRGGRWMDSEAFSRIYLMHQLSPVVCLWRELGGSVVDGGAAIGVDLHAWIVTAATALALTSYDGKSAMIGARSVSDPPAHLSHWGGDKILRALREGTNPYEDDGSLSSKAHRAMWGDYEFGENRRLYLSQIGRVAPGFILEELPGVLGVWELYRYESGVLWVCRDTTGLAVDSTDPGLAGWSGEVPGTHKGGGWHGEGVSFWWGYGDGRRGGGRHYRPTVDVGCLVGLLDDGHVHLSVAEAARGPLLYRLRWDSSGCRRIDGETLRNEEESAGDTNQPDLTARNKWPSLINGPSFGEPLPDPDDEAVRLVLWRILKTGGASSDILDDLRAHLGASSSSADREIADAARRLWEVMA